MNATADHTRDASGREYDVRSGMRYRMGSTHRGSKALGPCEVCHQPADEVFLQTAQRYVEAEGGFWTQHECPQAFGHEACLLSVRS